MGRLVVIGANARRRQARRAVRRFYRRRAKQVLDDRRPAAKKFVSESAPYPYLYAKMHRTAPNGEQHAD
ncbi:hypothetical protein AS149_24345 [Burkholderia cenocepacia]|nr:hypothetical protein AS149_24345 [Burkholderia cenocepacia]